jgi:hypothetical protein
MTKWIIGYKRIVWADIEVDAKTPQDAELKANAICKSEIMDKYVVEEEGWQLTGTRRRLNER